MPFHLRVSFTGICAFVPNANFYQVPKVCVVLPNGEDSPFTRKSLDGKLLQRHRPFLRFHAKNIQGMPKVPEDSLAVWHLTRRQVVFTPSPLPDPLKIVSLKDAADLAQVAPDYSAVDPLVVNGDTRKITSRLILDRGELSTDTPAGPWRVAPILSPHIVRFPYLAQEVVWKLTNLDSLEISVTPLTGGTNQYPLQLEAPDGEWVNISIVNLCDINPLQWAPPRASVPDEDFKWYFELLPDAKITELAKLLSGLELPILVPEGQPDGRGQNCFPAVTSPLSF